VSQVPIYFLLSLPLVGAFAMFALGVVAIYQASRVLNLAHGAMAMVPVYIVFELHPRVSSWVAALGLPAWISSPFVVLIVVTIGVASGALLGVAVERFFIRNLRPRRSSARRHESPSTSSPTAASRSAHRCSATATSAFSSSR
jgi:branched-subunit amino acid ABC-type transport system permease component